MVENRANLYDKLNRLFRLLMQKDDISIYPYQQRVAAAVLAGTNLILRAPTGAGKTWAALLPYILGRVEGEPLFDRVLYSLPLRSLAGQLYGITRDACRAVSSGNKNIHSIAVTVQTGEQQEDPFFQGDIIFTTIDQLLSAYLLAPVSLPLRLANINAGALLGSLVVFDEFHLLDPQRSMGTAIEMLDRLSGYCNFIIMTATLSDSAIEWLQKKLPRTTTIDLDVEEIAQIESKKGEPTARKWVFADGGPSFLADILQAHQSRTLVIANTVSRAQEIYTELCRLSSGTTEIRLLHSRFYPEDRGKTEQELQRRLGKGSWQEPDNFILVSTQVVEAGMDFSVERLYSELAPINSLVQRAGRCARYGGEGTVTVFPASGYPPYSKEEMEETAALLQGLSGKVWSWREEQAAVNKVLGAREVKFLKVYENLYQRRTKVNQAMDGWLESVRDELIRDINNVNVVVTDKPEAVQLQHTGSWPATLSVPVSSMRSFLQKASAQPSSEWVVKAPFAVDPGLEEDYALKFTWRELNVVAIPGAWLLAINPAYAFYSAELGLVLGRPGGGSALRYRDRGTLGRYRYRMETMGEHVERVLQQYRLQHQGYSRTLQLLARNLGLTKEQLEQAGLLACILHDAGKLSVDWQSIARAYQESKTPGRAPPVPLSHLDFDPLTDRDVPRRPPHAVEGAYAVCLYLYQTFEGAPELAACIITAIARHHAGHALKLGAFSIDGTAADALNKCLSREGLPLLNSLWDRPDEAMRGGQFARELIAACNEQDGKWLALYWYLVRRLRLADQAGTAAGTAEGVKE